MVNFYKKYQYFFMRKSYLSSTTAIAAETTSKTAGDVFLDNLGNIFFGLIAMIILALVRSSKGATNKMNLRDWIEQTTVIDPSELDDLRIANSEFTPEVFRFILEGTTKQFPNGQASYSEFVTFVKQEMQRIKGEEFKIQLGHLLDRVVSRIVEFDENVFLRVENDLDKVDEIGNARNKEKMDTSLLLVILSLAVYASIRERVQILFHIMCNEGPTTSIDSARVTDSQIVDMIAYLQQTCQLVPDIQIVESEIKYPIQEYRIGTPLELTTMGKISKKNDLSSELWSCNDFHHLLRSKSVCAWGECYVKKQSLS